MCLILLLEAGKVSSANAKTEVGKAVAGCVGATACFEKSVQLKEEGEIEKLERLAAEEVAKIPKSPWRSFPEVTTFEAQFAPERCLDRRKTLVLDGESYLAKTAFAMSLVGPGEGVEICCSNVDDEPPLQAAYSPIKHNLILFDEMKPALMIRNKRLFQGPPTRVILGATRTNKYTYAAFVFRKRMVVGSNCWAEELAKLPEGDQKWIRANTIYLNVTTPMFYAEALANL